MNKRFTAVCIATAVAMFAGTLTQADVLIAGANSQGFLDDVRQKIRQTGILAGHSIDTFNLISGTPTRAQLNHYDAVLSYTSGDPQNAILWGNRLAWYVDSGGGLLQMHFSWTTGNAGRLFTDGYTPFLPGADTHGFRLRIGRVRCQNHPIMWNVNIFNGGNGSAHNDGGFAPGAIAIADWEDGFPFAAEMPGFNARIVALNFHPPSNDTAGSFWISRTDGDILMANALSYVMTPPGPIPSTVAGFMIKNGRLSSGDVFSLGASDNDRLIIDARMASTQYSTKMRVNLLVASPDVTRLSLHIESSGNQDNIYTRVRLYDFDAQRWRILGRFTESRDDQAHHRLNLADHPNRFISRNGVVKILITTLSTDNAFTTRTDHVEALIKPARQ